MGLKVVNKSNLAGVLAFAVTLLAGQPAAANPAGPDVVNGQVQFNLVDPAVLEVTNTPNAIINWQSFSIGAGEITRFIQENASSAVLNRVVGNDLSSILGQLISNGQVYLINPNGIVFGPGSVVDTAGLVASTLNMSDADFLAGNLDFLADDSGAGSILNEGTLTTSGNLLLIASDIRNEGVLYSENGTVMLAAGESVLAIDPEMMDVAIKIRAPENTALNVGEIIAGRGAGLFGSGVEQAGSIEVAADGSVRLLASGDTFVRENASIIAEGGHVEVLGDRVALLSGVSIDVSSSNGGGSVLIGGDYLGGGDVPTASATYVDAGAEIRADGLESGDGGKVIVWADEVTRYYGVISARGGALGGDGGFVETSGKEHLEAVGSVDASAPAGAPGEWLLDPRDVTLKTITTTMGDDSTGGTFNAMNPNVFDPTADSAMADLDQVVTSLEAGTSVTITTGSTGTQFGTILLDDPLSVNLTANPVTLRLDAAFQNVINNPITATGTQALNLNLEAGSSNTIAANIDTNGGVLDTTADTGGLIFSGTPTVTASTISSSGISLATAQSATLNATTITTDDLTLSGTASLTLNGATTVNDMFAWNGGTLAGSGSIAVAAGVTPLLAMGTGSNRTLDTITLTNQSTNPLNEWSSRPLAFANNGSFVNEGFFKITGGVDTSGAAGSFVNSAGANLEFDRTGFSAIYGFTVPLTNDGTLTINNTSGSGVTEVQANLGGSATGSFVVNANTELEFRGSGIFNLNAGGSVTGAGLVTKSGNSATLNVNGGTFTPSDLVVSGGVMNFDTTGSVNNLTVSGGGDYIQGASGNLTVNTLFSMSGAGLNELDITNGTFNYSGDFNWTGGRLIGGSMAIPALGTLTISGAAAKRLDNFTLTNNSTAGSLWSSGNITFTNSGSFVNNGFLRAVEHRNMSGAGTFINAVTGTLELDATTPPLSNDVFSFAAGFENHGTVDVQNSAGGLVSRVNLNGTGTPDTVHTGTWNLNANTRLEFAGVKDHNVNSGAIFNGPGGVENRGNSAVVNINSTAFSPGFYVQDAGSTNVNASVNMGDLTIDGGILALELGATLTAPTFLVTGGTLDSSNGIFNFTGTDFSWSGASTLRGPNTLTVPAAGTLTISTDISQRTLDGFTLINNSTQPASVWDNGSIRLMNGASIVNNGLLKIHNGRDFVFASGGGTVTNNLSGTLTVDWLTDPGAGGATSLFDTPFVNHGTIIVQNSFGSGTATLDLSGPTTGRGSTHNGTMMLGVNTLLRLRGSGLMDPSHDFNSGSSLTGLGSLALNGNIPVNLDGTVDVFQISGLAGLNLSIDGTVTTDELNQNGGNIDVSATGILNVTDLFDMDAGTMTVNPGGTFNFTGTDFEWFNGTLTMPGTVTVPVGGTLDLGGATGAGALVLDGFNLVNNSNNAANLFRRRNLQFNNGATFTNNGLLNIESSPGVFGAGFTVGSGGGSVTNSATGTMVSDSVSGTTTRFGAGLTFNQNGVFQVQDSTAVGNLLRIDGTLNSTGSFSADTNTTIQLDGGDPKNLNAGSFTGAGSLNFSGTDINLGNVTLSMGPTTVLPTNVVDLTGSTQVTNELVWDGTTLMGTGSESLTVTSTGFTTIDTDRSIDGANLINQSNSASGLWAEGELSLANNGQFTNQGTFKIEQWAAQLPSPNLLAGTGSGTFRNDTGANLVIERVTGTTDFSAATNFENLGNITLTDSAGGGVFTLFLNGGSTTNSGASAWTLNANTLLDLNTGTHNLTAGTFSGAGQINLTGTTFNYGAVTINNTSPNPLVLSSGTFNVTGNSFINFDFDWSGGTITGGGTLTIGNLGSLDMTGATKTIDNATLVNQSTLAGNDWNTGLLDLINGATFQNDGTLQINNLVGGMTPDITSSVGTGNFNNTGTLNFDAVGSTDLFFIDAGVTLDNSGTVNLVNSVGGTQVFDILENSTHTGTWNIGSGIDLRFGGGAAKTHNIQTGSSFSGTGNVILKNGDTLNVDHAFTSAGTWIFESGVVSLGAAGSLNIPSFTVNNPASSVTFSGTAANSIVVPATGTFVMTGNGNVRFDNVSFAMNSNGAGNLWNGGDLDIRNGGIFTNNGTWKIEQTSGFTNEPDIFEGGGGGTFVNAGTINYEAVSANNPFNTSGLGFANQGSVNIINNAGGTLLFDLETAGTQSGVWTVGSGAELRFLGSGETHTWSSGTSFSGAGTVAVGGSSILNVDHAFISTAPFRFETATVGLGTSGTMNLSNLTINNPGTLSITGSAFNAVTVGAGGQFVKTGNGSLLLDNARIQLNSGSLLNVWDSGVLDMRNNGNFTIAGTGRLKIELLTGTVLPDILDNGTPAGFSNNGILDFIATSTVGTVTFRRPMSNQGTVNLTNNFGGTLTVSLINGGQTTGSYTANAGTLLSYGGVATHQFGAGAGFGGAGSYQTVAGADTRFFGDTTITSNWTQNSELVMTGGTLDVTGSLSFNVLGDVTMTGGTLDIATLLMNSGILSVGGATINGNVDLSGGSASFNPGSSPGISTITGNLLMGAATVTNIEIFGATVGTQYDQIQVGGNLNLGGTVNFLFNQPPLYTPPASSAFNFINYSGTGSGSFGTINNAGTGSVLDSGSIISLNFGAPPPPPASSPPSAPPPPEQVVVGLLDTDNTATEKDVFTSAEDQDDAGDGSQAQSSQAGGLTGSGSGDLEVQLCQ